MPGEQSQQLLDDGGVLTVAMVMRQRHLRWLKDVPGLGTVVFSSIWTE